MTDADIAASVPLLEPPGWALAERALLNLLDHAWRRFAQDFTGPDGRLNYSEALTSRDGVDDFYEVFFNWPLLYLLGGANDLLAEAGRHWEGVTAQLTELGMLKAEYERGYDWFHQGESLLLLYFLTMADPSMWARRAVRFANLYVDPPKGNYDRRHRIIRRPHNGSDPERTGLFDGTHYPWLDTEARAYGFPLDWVLPDDAPEPERARDPRLSREMAIRMGSGDTAVNLAATGLVLNAWIATGDRRYRDWIEQYVGAWRDRANVNGGIVPDNVGPDGVVGSLLDGRWYGGHYGWTWPHGWYSVGSAATVAALAAALATGDDGYLDMVRQSLDTVTSRGKVMPFTESDSSLPGRWHPQLGQAVTAPTLLVPYRHSDRGWFDYNPMLACIPMALWHHGNDPADRQRLEELREQSGYDWRTVRSFRSKEEAGHEEPWFAFLAGDNPDYPEKILAAAQAQVRHRLTRMQAYRDTRVSEADIHLWQQCNPVVTEALVQLTWGGPQVIYNGGLQQARVRYYDADRRRPGLPASVAALVSSIDPAATVVELVNLNPGQDRCVIVQAGAFAEHTIQAVRYTACQDRSWFGDLYDYGHGEPSVIERCVDVDGPWLTVRLPASTRIRLTITLALRTRKPSYTTPFLPPIPPRRMSMSRVGRYRGSRAVVITGSALLAMVTGVVVPAASAAAASSAGVVNLYVAPGAERGVAGAGTGSAQRPFASIAQAEQTAHELSARSDVVVHLAGGVYRLTRPLRFTSADSAQNGHTIRYEAPAGQRAVMTGSQQVTGWTLQNQASNIWVASIGTGTNTRQLYVNGAEAPRASVSVPRSDFTFTSTGMTFTDSSLSYLDGLSDQNQIDVESVDSFTDRYSPVQSISGGTITMQQPAWNNNAWGYDTLNAPFAGGAMYLENNYAFLQQAGQWAIDSATGQLYYKAASGQNPNNLDIELPKQQVLVQVSGSYSNPVTGLSFNNMTFTGATWLGPSGSNGYADQQAGTFITGTWQQPAYGSCSSGCQLFEATREYWAQMPAAVQVSAASNITFSGDTFTDLGEAGLGVGQDANANASGTGLGASGVTITGSTFTNDAGSGIVVGGVQTDAHHPSNSAMINQNITVTGNHVTNVGTDYKEVPAILSTYVTGATISHNQVDHLPYDGIDVGWGWGMNDAGGSQDYANRGTYNYQPRYTTPTTLKNTTVSYNLIFDTKNVMHDGGSIYNLSANPGGIIQNNYMYNNNGTVALYLDEGSRYLTVSNNVVQDAGVWAFTNANPNNNTNDSTFSGNWYNGGATQVATGSPHNNVLSNNVQVSGYNWPSGAQQVISQAGIQNSSGGGFPSGYHRLVVGNDSLCLDVYGNTTAGGAAIDQWTCNGQSNQQFQFTPGSGGYGVLAAQNSGDDITVTGSATAQGTPDIVQEPAGSSASARWLPVQQSDGSWEFKNSASGLCLDVYGAGGNLGQQLDQWPCKNAPGTNQDFTPH